MNYIHWNCRKCRSHGDQVCHPRMQLGSLSELIQKWHDEFRPDCVFNPACIGVRFDIQNDLDLLIEALNEAAK